MRPPNAALFLRLNQSRRPLSSGSFGQVNPGVGEADRLDPVFEDLLFTEKSIYDDLAVLDRDLRDIFHDRLLGAGRV
jgi:hypothetical protein